MRELCLGWVLGTNIGGNKEKKSSGRNTEGKRGGEMTGEEE